jgi:hypothetical protein
MPSRKWIDWKLILTFLILGIASCWSLWEQDIFWQIKAGQELLQSWTFPLADSWSFSAQGQPWRNHQWLSTLILGLMNRTVPSSVGLIFFRVAGALGLLFLIYRTAIRDHESFVFGLCVVLISFLILSDRIQLRSEFFVFPIVFWLRTRRSVRSTDVWLDLFLVIVSVQLHPGVAPFAVGAAILRRLDRQRDVITGTWIFLAIGVLSLWINPYPNWTFDYLLDHLNYTNLVKLSNPEHGGLLKALSQGTANGLGYWLFPSISLVVLFSSWRRKAYLMFAAYFGIILLSTFKTRAIPFCYFLVFPELIEVAKRYFISVSQRRQFYLSMFVTSLFVAHVSWSKRPLGLGLNAFSYPVEALKFIESDLAKRMDLRELRLFHSPSTGNYLFSASTLIPVFIDTREMMYREVQVDFLTVASNPNAASAIFERYGINAALLLTDFVAGRESVLFPQDAWTLVFSDDDYVLILRNTLMASFGSARNAKLE